MDFPSFRIIHVSLSAGLVRLYRAGSSILDAAFTREKKRTVSKTVHRSISIISRAEGARKCSICMGLIKQELPGIDCACYSKFHRSCAIRIGYCPICEREIQIPPYAVQRTEPVRSAVRSMPLSADDRLFLLEDQFLMKDIDYETYEKLKKEISVDPSGPGRCGSCGVRLYPGEECGCENAKPIQCSECGNEVEKGGQFCRSCGIILREDFSEELFQCSSCDRIVLSSERLCTCGALLLDPGDSVCGECGHPIPPGALACPGCGLTLFIELLECPECGEQVGAFDFECPCGAIFEDRIERAECPECSQEIAYDDRYCRSCGVQFNTEPELKYNLMP